MYGLGFNPLTDTAEQAASYIESKIAAFHALGPKIYLMMHQASHVAAAANAAGDVTAAEQAKETLAELSSLYIDWGHTDDKVSAVASTLGLGQLVTIAAILGGTAAVLALAGAMYGIFRKSDAAEKSLALVAQGVLTPQEAAKLAQDRASDGTGLFSGLGSAVKAVATVAALFIGYKVVTDLNLGKRSW